MSQDSMLGLPLGLTVQILEERGQHGDVGWVTSAEHITNNMTWDSIANSEDIRLRD